MTQVYIYISYYLQLRPVHGHVRKTSRPTSVKQSVYNPLTLFSRILLWKSRKYVIAIIISTAQCDLSEKRMMRIIEISDSTNALTVKIFD